MFKQMMTVAAVTFLGISLVKAETPTDFDAIPLKAEGRVGQRVTYSATLLQYIKDGPNSKKTHPEPLPNEPVTFAVYYGPSGAGTILPPQTHQTDHQGRVTFTFVIPSGLKPGVYPCNVTFTGTAQYKPAPKHTGDLKLDK